MHQKIEPISAITTPHLYINKHLGRSLITNSQEVQTFSSKRLFSTFKLREWIYLTQIWNSQQLIIYHVVTICLSTSPSALLTALYPRHDKTNQDLQWQIRPSSTPEILDWKFRIPRTQQKLKAFWLQQYCIQLQVFTKCTYLVRALGDTHCCCVGLD